MNKLAILILGLLATVYFVQADLPQELENELADEDNETLDGDSKLNSMWGRDVLETGVPKLVEAQRGPCYDKRTRNECEACCETQNKAFSFPLTMKEAMKFKLHVCHCYERNNA